jgi:hypothetical protein
VLADYVSVAAALLVMSGVLVVGAVVARPATRLAEPG